MSIFSRRNKAVHAVLEPEDDSDLPPRMRFPRGVFAALETDPPEAADAAYAAFARHALTPVVAEREIFHIFNGCGISNPALESNEMFQYDFQRETTDNGRLRVIVRWLVTQQHAHEANLQTLRLFEKGGTVRRVTVLPGCCPACDKLAKKRFRLGSTPVLPVEGCRRHGGCICAWVPALD